MKNWTKAILISLLLIAVVVWAEVFKSPSESKDPMVYFLDVGQGDSELIQKGNFQILIDGGPDDKVLQELGKVMPISDRKIEIMILSHPDADHITGLNQVLSRYEVGAIYSTGVLDTTDQYYEFTNKIKSMKVSYTVPKVDESVSAFADGKLTFLWPGDKYEGQSPKEENNSSEVVQFCYFSHCALFTGDQQTEEQAQMLAYYSQISSGDSSGTTNSNGLSIFKSDILKVPHHGSKTAAGADLFNAVAPQYAVIEVGAKNTYGLPSPETLTLLQKINAQILRTDQSGTIKFQFTSNSIELLK